MSRSRMRKCSPDADGDYDLPAARPAVGELTGSDLEGTSDGMLVVPRVAALVRSVPGVTCGLDAGAACSLLGFWTANCWVFFSSSSLGNSRDTVSPAFKPSWISA